MFTHYYYDDQIRGYLLQFAGIFSNLQVMTGVGESGTTEMMSVPIHVGNRDRVVAAIAAGNTQNKMFQLPLMSAYIQSIELAPERMHGVGQLDRQITMPQGGVYPDDIKVAKRYMPIPYNLTMELSIYASNTKQLHQILEQILLIFDPILQIQTNDSPLDWTRLTYVELIGINNEENYPAGTERRMLIWSLNFKVPIWISPPMDVKNEVVKRIRIRLGELDRLQLNEIDEDGGVTPFSALLASDTVIETQG